MGSLKVVDIEICEDLFKSRDGFEETSGLSHVQGHSPVPWPLRYGDILSAQRSECVHHSGNENRIGVDRSARVKLHKIGFE